MQTENRRVTQEDYEALADFRYALRKFLRFSEEAAAAVGLTPQQYQGLLAIRGFPVGSPMTVGGLAERLQFRPHTAVALVNRLARAGLVIRTPAPDDRRKVFISLTDQGADVLEKLAGVHRDELRCLEPHLTEMSSYLRGEK